MYKPSLESYRRLSESIEKEFQRNCELFKLYEEKITMRKEFTKADLENLMVVEYRCGDRRIVVDNSLIGPHRSGCLNDYGMNLLCRHAYPDLDIVKVYRKIEKIDELDSVGILIWERKEPKEVTLKEIAEKFGVDEVKIIDG